VGSAGLPTPALEGDLLSVAALESLLARTPDFGRDGTNLVGGFVGTFRIGANGFSGANSFYLGMGAGVNPSILPPPPLFGEKDLFCYLSSARAYWIGLS